MRLRRDRSARWQQVPDGMRDVLPLEAERRLAVAGALREEFRRWGYREVATPTVEFLETFLQGAGPGVQDRLFKIVDAGGELLALRPEMTVPIARLAATRLLAEAPRPLRVAYVAPVFRGQEAGRGRLREFTQAGVELLGAPGPDADAEVIALAAGALRRAGVPTPVLHVGELGFLNDALGGLSDEAQDDVRLRLYRKEFAGIEAAVSDPSLSRFLHALPDLHGPDALECARPFARSAGGIGALERIGTILERLADYGVADLISVDLTIIRDFSYYTGVVFEAYGDGAGYPLLGGGRYDTLLGRFGAPCPATGFAMGIDRVLAASRGFDEARLDFVVVAPEEIRAQALRLARQIRDLGKSAVVASDTPPGEGDGQGGGARSVVCIEGGRLRVQDAEGGGERILDSEEFTAELLGRPKVISWTH